MNEKEIERYVEEDAYFNFIIENNMDNTPQRQVMFRAGYRLAMEINKTCQLCGNPN